MAGVRSGNVVAIISGKGGAGKTSVALSLAKYLALLGKRVLVIDADSATHGATYFDKNHFSLGFIG